MKRIILLMLVLCVIAHPAFSQQVSVEYQEPEYLEPENGIFSSHGDFELGYSMLVASKLMPKLDQQDELSIVVLPSFSPEWALSVNGEESIVTLARCKTQLWSSKAATKVQVAVVKMTLPNELARRVIALGNRNLENTRYSRSNLLGTDGTSFHFFGIDRKNHEIRSGKIWSPSLNVPVGKLVALIEILKEATLAAEPEKLTLIESLQSSISEAENSFP